MKHVPTPATEPAVPESREPYVLRLCEPHLEQLMRVLPAAGVQIVERYQVHGRRLGDQEG